MNEMIVRWPERNPRLFLAVAALVWFGLYEALIPVSEVLVAALPVDRNSHLGGALQFFLRHAQSVDAVDWHRVLDGHAQLPLHA